MHIPRVDNFEASVLTSPRKLRSGDRIATGWSTHDLVLDVRLSTNGAHLTLSPGRGRKVYTIHRRTPVPVIHD